MPILTLPVPDTKDSITRPVVSVIINELFDILGWNRNEINVFYPDESGTVYQHNTQLEDKNQFSSRMPGTEHLWVEVDDEYAEDAFFQNETYKEEEPFIFADDKLRVWLKPTHTACEVSINFRYKATDRTQAERWRNQMRARMNNYQDLNHHLLEYHYLIPRVQVYLIQEIHKLRESNHPLNEALGQWYKRCGTVRFTTISNQSGEKTNLAVAEKQMRVFGHWDFEMAPEKGSKENNNETWTISCTYKFRYERPTNVTLVYPLMVHNQLLPTNLRPTHDRERNMAFGTDRSFSLTGYLFEHFIPDRQHERAQMRRGVTTPRFDEWVAPTTIPRTCRLLQVLTMLNEEDYTELFRLDDYENLEYTMEGIVMDFLATEAKWINLPLASVFNVSLYNQYSQLHHKYIKMVDDGTTTLTATENLNPRNYYHVRLSLHENWGDLHPQAIDRLFKHPKVVEALLKHLGYDDLVRWINDHGGFDNYYKGRDGLIDDIIGKMADKPPYEDPRMRTVQMYSILTYRDDPNDPLYYKELLNQGGYQLKPEENRY